MNAPLLQRYRERKMSARKIGSLTFLVGLTWVVVAPTVTSADREDAALRTLVPKIVATWGTMDISKVAPYDAADADLAYFDIVPLK
jgi:hypothetical protein